MSHDDSSHLVSPGRTQVRPEPLASPVLPGAIALTRARDFFAVCRSIRLYIDGENEVGAVFYGRREVFSFQPGVYSLSVEMDWCSSSDCEVVVRPGELIELEASLRWRGLFWCWALFAMFLLPGRFFMLRRVGKHDRSTRHNLWEAVGMVLSLVIALGLTLLLGSLVATIVG